MTPERAMSGVYLVQYGRSGFVGRFTSALPDVSRGAAVVVRTPRGVELGTALCPVEERLANSIDPASGGELLRTATPADRSQSALNEQTGLTLLGEATRRAAAVDLPVAFVDVEVLLDGSAVVLHALPCGPCDADPLLADLSAEFGFPVRLFDVSRSPTRADPSEPKTSCGKPDCGSGSGGCSSCGTGKSGCSTGGCSRGSVKTADELTAYFADLRSKMDARRTPLH